VVDSEAISREKQLDCSSILEDHGDYCEIPPPLPPTLSSFKAAVISYIAGFVIHNCSRPYLVFLVKQF
ncbi:Hypothetical protein FKW44_014257, partial [Caligus rogercresseyi]